MNLGDVASSLRDEEINDDVDNDNGHMSIDDNSEDSEDAVSLDSINQVSPPTFKPQ